MSGIGPQVYGSSWREAAERFGNFQSPRAVAKVHERSVGIRAFTRLRRDGAGIARHRAIYFVILLWMVFSIGMMMFCTMQPVIHSDQYQIVVLA